MEFKEKIDLLERAIAEFKSGVQLDFSRIVAGLSIDDILSRDFEERFLNLFPYTGEKTDEGDIRFMKTMQRVSSYASNYGSTLVNRFSREPENLRKLADKYIEYSKATKNLDLQNSPFNNTSEESYIAAMMIDDDELSASLSNPNSLGILFKTWDKILSASDQATIEKLIAHIEDNKIDYTNLPLVILNPNISNDSKIEIIKKTYKQKDLNKYTVFMRENIVDLMDLDSFIEATIVQNNRVKEKDKAVFDIIKRIFVGVRNNSSSFNYSNKQNTKAFFEKYRHYFTVSFCNRIIGENNYYIRRNSKQLIVKAFETAPFEEKMMIAAKVDDIGREMVDDIKSDINRYKGDAKIERLIAEYVINKNSIISLYSELGREEFVRYANSMPDIIAGEIGNLIEIDSRRTWRRGVDKEDGIFVLKNLSDDVYSHDSFNILENSRNSYNYATPEVKLKRMMSFGLHDTSENSDNSDRFETFESICRDLGTTMSVVDNAKFKEVMFNKIFSAYIDDEFVASDLLTILSAALNKRTVTSIANSKNIRENDVVSTVINIIKKLFQDVYPEKYEDLESSMNSLETNLSILINI